MPLLLASAVKRADHELQWDRTRKVNQALLNRRWRHEKKRGENNHKGISAFDRITKFPGQHFESRGVGNCVAVPAVSSYLLTSPHWNTKAWLRRESTAQGKQDEGRCHGWGTEQRFQETSRRRNAAWGGARIAQKSSKTASTLCRLFLVGMCVSAFVLHWPGIAKLNKRWTPGITFGTVYFMDSSPFPWERERERERGGGGVHDKGHLCRQGCLYDV